MADHAYFEELICAAADGELSPEEERELRAHLEICPDCRAYAEVMGAVAGLAAEPTVEPPTGFSAAVMDRVRAQAVSEPSKTAKTRIFRFHYKPVLAAAAAALVLLAGFSAASIFRPKGASGGGEMLMMADMVQAAKAEEAPAEVGGAYDAGDAPMAAGGSEGFNAAAMAAPEAADVTEAAEDEAFREAEEDSSLGDPIRITLRGGEILYEGKTVVLAELAERLAEDDAPARGVDLEHEDAEEELADTVADLLESLEIPVI